MRETTATATDAGTYAVILVEGGESVGLAVGGGNPQRLGGHEFSCRG
jgi:hypothetical protein